MVNQMDDKTKADAAAKIAEIDHNASRIHGDWSDPRDECRKIYDLCEELAKLLGLKKEVKAYEEANEQRWEAERAW